MTELQVGDKVQIVKKQTYSAWIIHFTGGFWGLDSTYAGRVGTIIEFRSHGSLGAIVELTDKVMIFISVDELVKLENL